MSAATRFISILDAFTVSGGPLTLKQIADSAGLPVSTTHRLLADLLAVGAVEKDEERRYSVGVRMFAIGSSVPRASAYRSSVRSELERLFSDMRVPAFVAIADETGRAVVIDECSLDVDPTRSRVGRNASAASAAGLVVAAFGRDWWSAFPGEEGPYAEIRSRGYASVADPRRRGSLDLAVPIRRDGRLFGVIGISVEATPRVSGARLRELAGAARRIERLIAHRDSEDLTRHDGVSRRAG